MQNPYEYIFLVTFTEFSFNIDLCLMWLYLVHDVEDGCKNDAFSQINMPMLVDKMCDVTRFVRFIVI